MLRLHQDQEKKLEEALSPDPPGPYGVSAEFSAVLKKVSYRCCSKVALRSQEESLRWHPQCHRSHPKGMRPLEGPLPQNASPVQELAIWPRRDSARSRARAVGPSPANELTGWQGQPVETRCGCSRRSQVAAIWRRRDSAKRRARAVGPSLIWLAWAMVRPACI
jgi:hypothetical protein